MNFDIEKHDYDGNQVVGEFVSNTLMDIRRSMADSSFVIPL
jgi:hypothetical protein